MDYPIFRSFFLLVCMGLAGCVNAPSNSDSSNGSLRGVPYEYYGDHHPKPPVPGDILTPDVIERRYVAEGYVFGSAPVRDGVVYDLEVYDIKQRHFCLVVHGYSGIVLQKFVYGPSGSGLLGLRALNQNTPGPGYPGYPHMPDARYTKCPLPELGVVAPKPVKKHVHKKPVRKRPKVRCYCEPGDVTRDRPLSPPVVQPSTTLPVAPSVPSTSSRAPRSILPSGAEPEAAPVSSTHGEAVKGSPSLPVVKSPQATSTEPPLLQQEKDLKIAPPAPFIEQEGGDIKLPRAPRSKLPSDAVTPSLERPALSPN